MAGNWGKLGELVKYMFDGSYSTDFLNNANNQRNETPLFNSNERKVVPPIGYYTTAGRENNTTEKNLAIITKKIKEEEENKKLQQAVNKAIATVTNNNNINNANNKNNSTVNDYVNKIDNSSLFARKSIEDNIAKILAGGQNQNNNINKNYSTDVNNKYNTYASNTNKTIQDLTSELARNQENVNTGINGLNYKVARPESPLESLAGFVSGNNTGIKDIAKFIDKLVTPLDYDTGDAGALNNALKIFLATGGSAKTKKDREKNKIIAEIMGQISTGNKATYTKEQEKLKDINANKILALRETGQNSNEIAKLKANQVLSLLANKLGTDVDTVKMMKDSKAKDNETLTKSKIDAFNYDVNKQDEERKDQRNFLQQKAILDYSDKLSNARTNEEKLKLQQEYKNGTFVFNYTLQATGDSVKAQDEKEAFVKRTNAKTVSQKEFDILQKKKSEIGNYYKVGSRTLLIQ